MTSTPTPRNPPNFNFEKFGAGPLDEGREAVVRLGTRPAVAAGIARRLEMTASSSRSRCARFHGMFKMLNHNCKEQGFRAGFRTIENQFADQLDRLGKAIHC